MLDFKRKKFGFSYIIMVRFDVVDSCSKRLRVIASIRSRNFFFNDFINKCVDIVGRNTIEQVVEYRL